MTKQDLIEKIAAIGNLDKKGANRALSATALALEEALKETGEVTLPGIGKLTVKAKPARKGRRLSILLVLMESGGYRCNEYLLRTALDALGHAVSGDRLATDLAWLKEQGLIALETVGGVAVATLGAQGLDVATGRTVTPGVKRPLPE